MFETSKFCPGCQQDRPLSSYAIRRQSKDGLTSRCSDCRKVVSAARYQRHMVQIKAAANESKRAARQRNYEYLVTHRSTHPCVDCGETDPDVLDFDHVRGEKVRSVYEESNRGVSLARLQAEMAKCEVRCANCHRRITRRRERESRERLREAG